MEENFLSKTMIIAVVNGKTIDLMDTMDMTTVASVEVPGVISEVEFSPDGSVLLGICNDVLYVWGADDLEPIIQISDCLSYAVNPITGEIAIVGKTGIRLQSITGEIRIKSLPFQIAEQRRIRYSPDGSLIAFSRSTRLSIHDANLKTIVWTVIGDSSNRDCIVSFSFTKQNRYIIARSYINDKPYAHIIMVDGLTIQGFKEDVDEMNYTRVYPIGNSYFDGNYRNYKIVDADTNEVTDTRLSRHGEVYAVSDDGVYAFKSKDRELMMVNIQTGEEQFVTREYDAVAIQPEGVVLL